METKLEKLTLQLTEEEELSGQHATTCRGADWTLLIDDLGQDPVIIDVRDT